MEKTVDYLVAELRKLSKDVTDEELKDVATVSAGGNEKVRLPDMQSQPVRWAPLAPPGAAAAALTAAAGRPANPPASVLLPSTREFVMFCTMAAKAMQDLQH